MHQVAATLQLSRILALADQVRAKAVHHISNLGTVRFCREAQYFLASAKEEYVEQSKD